jgi:hypothetical protein
MYGAIAWGAMVLGLKSSPSPASHLLSPQPPPLRSALCATAAAAPPSISAAAAALHISPLCRPSPPHLLPLRRRGHRPPPHLLPRGHRLPARPTRRACHGGRVRARSSLLPRNRPSSRPPLHWCCHRPGKGSSLSFFLSFSLMKLFLHWPHIR